MQDYIIYDDVFKEEKIDGKIYLMARPTDEHIDVQANITTIFNEYFKKNKKRCRARSEAQLYINKNNYLIPDVMVFCYENSEENNIPLIVIEILSKSTRGKDIGIKMKKYAEIGIKEYWIVDWKSLSIDIYLLAESKLYELYKSYAYFTVEDFSEIPEIREKEQAEIEIIHEFSPVSMPLITIKIEDIFYFLN